jgi:cytochrome c-type biogenesis protein CcmF
MYRIAAVWGNHEGSLLLWVLMLRAGRWRWPVLAQLPEAHGGARARRAGPGQRGFLLFMLFTSNPFERLLPGPPTGAT